MKTLKNIIPLVLVLTLTFSCKDKSVPEVKTIAIESDNIKTLDPNATYAKAEFTIEGMTCAMGCAKTIEKKIAGMEGVKSSVVDFDKKLAMVEYDNAKVTPASLVETVSNVADVYKVTNMKTVEAFSTNDAKKQCDANCEKACCKNKTEAEKMACAEDCTKACCAKEA
ncbi:heavy-metal-associated domain-containing protein [Gaetbulibacter saemankumensis]|uniref:heavy-metal-associated domain-containing protein n=1 Tax=Gaetbulibacter saemankumensis TaxID=311208 RepID=UPI00047F15DC|nr:heavy metal-associated domain-containing protein [Gaetbulibacter saemankumensis]